jgi:hypothetical protein
MTELLIWFAAAAAGVAGALYLFKLARKAVRWVGTVVTKANNIYEALVGFGEVVDPQTGEVLRGPVPGINDRMLLVEAWQATAQAQLARLVDLMEADKDLSARLTKVEGRVTHLEGGIKCVNLNGNAPK